MQMWLGLIFAVVGWVLAIFAGCCLIHESADKRPGRLLLILVISFIVIVGSHAVWVF